MTRISLSGLALLLAVSVPSWNPVQGFVVDSVAGDGTVQAPTAEEGESAPETDDSEPSKKDKEKPTDDGEEGSGNQEDDKGGSDKSPAATEEANQGDKEKSEEKGVASTEKKPDEEPTKETQKDEEAERQKELQAEQNLLNAEYQLLLQRQKNQLAQMELEMKELQTKSSLDKARHDAELGKLQQEIERLTTEARLETLRRERGLNSYKLEAEILSAQNEVLKQKFAELKTKQDTEALNFQDEIQKISRAMTGIDSKRQAKNKVLREFEYRREPVDNGTLVISDRRITMNGVITMDTADYVAQRIAFFNNQSTEFPIFLVIDSSPGGSVMAGYRILKAMEGSEAPIHVVVKSFAASMAAIITTLAEESYAYPNAVLLHHQMSTVTFGNLKEIEEQLRIAQEWARRLMEPLAKKLGTSPDELVKQMYEHNSTGDWEEFADKAVTMKWVNRLVSDVREQAVVDNPDSQPSFRMPASLQLEERVDERGHRYIQLPRLEPFDGWFVYNPDNYYRP